MTECANEVDIPKDERLTPTSDKEIRPFKLSAHLKEGGNRKKRVVLKEKDRARRKVKEKTCEERKDGSRETDAASSPADGPHAHKEREGRTNIYDLWVGSSSHLHTRKRRFEKSKGPQSLQKGTGRFLIGISLIACTFILFSRC